MENEERNSSAMPRWRSDRGISMATGLIVLIIVLVVVAAGGFFAFNSVKPTTKQTSACSPPTSTVCLALAPTHDVTLFSPFKSAQAGTPIPFTATIPEPAKNFTFNFGDGSAPVVQLTPTATHTFSGPGAYIVSVQASVGGVLHNNYLKLLIITISPSFASTSAGNTAPVSGAISTNSSLTTGVPASAILQTGGSVTLSGAYTGQPTNPLYVLQSPTIVASTGGTIASPSNTTTTATAQVSFKDPGVHWATFVGSALGAAGKAYLNFTWTVFVAPTGQHAGSASAAAALSQHPGKLQYYELAPGGGRTQDPSLSYDTASGELVYNVYQTLISYNQTLAGPDPNDFTPTLAACVPGSGQCTGLFGSSLVNSSTGAFTFVISSSSNFYDPKSSSASWGVYPSDVFFTAVRTMGFANLPAVASNPGWILAQGLLPFGSSGIHQPFLNTPAAMASSMLVNSSTYCPHLATSDARFHGCITFLATGGGATWPYFLEFIADFEGMGIEPCGWFSASAQGGSIPGWTDNTNTATKANQGDHPCLLPGGAKSTDDPAFQTWKSTVSATAWDNWENTASTAPFVGSTQYAMAGSGPYYLANLAIGQNYLLVASPNYQANQFCTWTGCYPKAGAYAKSVNVVWESTATLGEQAYQAGQADHAGIPSSDTATLIEYIQQGKVVAVTAPTINIDNFFFNFNFSISGAHALTTNPVTVPSDFFSHIAAREFFARAYPYDTIQQTVNTVDGIQFAFNYGGAIPQFMGNYYPRNISWPSGDPGPASTPGSAAWWWAQGTTLGSPFYDSEMAACTTSNPCEFPFIGQTGSPPLDQRIALFLNQLSIQSGGTVKLSAVDINFNTQLGFLSDAPGKDPSPIYRLGWAPDYPDPTDYVLPYWAPDNAFTSQNAVAEQLAQKVYNQATYPGGKCMTGTGGSMNWSDVVGYAKMATTLNGIPEACQGWAYQALNYESNIAGSLPAGSARVLDYNLVEQIGNGLALDMYTFQPNVVTSIAPWIDASTVNVNIMSLGSSVWDFSQLGGQGVTG